MSYNVEYKCYTPTGKHITAARLVVNKDRALALAKWHVARGHFAKITEHRTRKVIFHKKMTQENPHIVI